MGIDLEDLKIASMKTLLNQYHERERLINHFISDMEFLLSRFSIKQVNPLNYSITFKSQGGNTLTYFYRKYQLSTEQVCQILDSMTEEQAIQRATNKVGVSQNSQEIRSLTYNQIYLISPPCVKVLANFRLFPKNCPSRRSKLENKFVYKNNFSVVSFSYYSCLLVLCYGVVSSNKLKSSMFLPIILEVPKEGLF